MFLWFPSGSCHLCRKYNVQTHSYIVIVIQFLTVCFKFLRIAPTHRRQITATGRNIGIVGSLSSLAIFLNVFIGRISDRGQWWAQRICAEWMEEFIDVHWGWESSSITNQPLLGYPTAPGEIGGYNGITNRTWSSPNAQNPNVFFHAKCPPSKTGIGQNPPWFQHISYQNSESWMLIPWNMILQPHHDICDTFPLHSITIYPLYPPMVGFIPP